MKLHPVLFQLFIACTFLVTKLSRGCSIPCYDRGGYWNQNERWETTLICRGCRATCNMCSFAAQLPKASVGYNKYIASNGINSCSKNHKVCSLLIARLVWTLKEGFDIRASAEHRLRYVHLELHSSRFSPHISVILLFYFIFGLDKAFRIVCNSNWWVFFRK